MAEVLTSFKKDPLRERELREHTQHSQRYVVVYSLGKPQPMDHGWN